VKGEERKEGRKKEGSQAGKGGRTVVFNACISPLISLVLLSLIIVYLFSHLVMFCIFKYSLLSLSVSQLVCIFRFLQFFHVIFFPGVHSYGFPLSESDCLFSLSYVRNSYREKGGTSNNNKIDTKKVRVDKRPVIMEIISGC